MDTKIINTTCCIAGGGPAGMMLGYLLARAGIQVVVLEKHKDFLRDFRGDTIHPSTFELLHELGLLEKFLQLPHQEVEEIGAQFDDRFLIVADFSHLPVAKPALGLMPQWDFLNFLQSEAAKYPTFTLLMNTSVYELTRENGRITGVMTKTGSSELLVNAALVIGADGRRSVVREKVALKVISSGAPIDVLWFRLAKNEVEKNKTFGRFYNGRMLVLIDRSEYYQCGFVIGKGEYDKLKAKGLDRFKNELNEMIPFLNAAIHNISSWDELSMLAVEVDHLAKWYEEGVICIGDAAHAMSPVAGVGINLAIQDAVATANILYPVLHLGKTIDIPVLKQIQRRRAFAARTIQRMQIMVHKTIIERHIKTGSPVKPPFLLLLTNKFPRMRRMAARLIGLGLRREHIRTPEKK